MTSFSVDTSGMTNIVKRLSNAKQELLDMQMDEAAQIIYQRVIENLEEGRSLFAPLKEATMRATGRTIPLGGGNESIALSIQIEPGTKNQITISSNHPGSRFHIHGTSRMPSRNFFDIPEETLQEVATLLAQQALDKFSERV